MGRTVGHRFHLNHQVFICHRLRKKRSDSGFSVQNLSDGNSYGYEPTELPGIFPDEKVWLLLSIIAENDFLKEQSQQLPNHHIVLVSIYAIPEVPLGNFVMGKSEWIKRQEQEIRCSFSSRGPRTDEERVNVEFQLDPTSFPPLSRNRVADGGLPEHRAVAAGDLPDDRAEEPVADDDAAACRIVLINFSGSHDHNGSATVSFSTSADIFQSPEMETHNVQGYMKITEFDGDAGKASLSLSRFHPKLPDDDIFYK